MNLFARILSHAFAILIVLLLAVSFVYRGDLFPEFDIPEYLSLEKAESTTPVEEQAAEAASVAKAESVPAGSEPETPPAMPAGEMPAVERPTTEPSVTEPQEAVQAAGSEAAEEAAAEIAVEPVPEAPPAGTPAAAEAEGIAEPPAEPVQPVAESAVEQAEETAGEQGVTGTREAETGTPGSVVAPVPAAPAAAESTGTGVTAPSEEAGQPPEAVTLIPPAIEETAPVPEAAPAPGSSVEAMPEPVPAAPEVATDEGQETAAMRPYQLLAKAREAFWLRDYAAAEKYYLALTRREPDNPDGFGELANMYFSQGKWEEATAAYYETGIRLINEGLLGHAGQMVEVIRGLNGTQADDLEQKIDAASNPAP